ncbi:hypothetical protein [Bradyrhizobium sp. ARR65]|uniref:hypothetical protein n=1 Tax=Bradyrhizobium sp. ARR65 TaxID=1040989 RepID=UPI000466FFBB|nr:hypothetical protein [Bradyrhizobium sp. ARR65]
MGIEPIGFLTILVGLLAMRLGYRAAFVSVIVAALFGAAAAILIGGANIQPAHLLLGFAIASMLARPSETAAAVAAVRAGQPGFWLLCLVVYGVASAIMIPRLLAGGPQIVPLGTSEYANTGTTVPLGPVSSNFTQSVYMIADLICFALTVAIASTQAGFRTVTSAVLAFAAGNVLLAVLDIGTYTTGTQALLDFIRNAQYTLHLDDEVYGLKRIVGSYPEASAFARATLGALAFTGTLWLCGRYSPWTGPLAVASLVLVVLSTSSTGLAGTPVVVLMLYLTLMLRGGFHPSRPLSSAVALCAPIVIAAVTLAVLLNDAAAETIRSYFDLLIFSKSSSDSGIERSSWNAYAIQNFFDSLGIGVGLGTVRTSSFPVALISSVGVLGTAFYLLFIASALLRRRGVPGSFPADVRMAARNACLALIIGDTLAAPSIEQGLLFYVLAGLACAEPEREFQEIEVAAHRPVGLRA